MLSDDKWKSIGRSLGLDDGHLNIIVSDNNDDKYEQCYKMLKTLHNNGNASYDKLANVFQQYGLQKVREDYCLELHDPPTKKPVAIGK